MGASSSLGQQVRRSGPVRSLVKVVIDGGTTPSTASCSRRTDSAASRSTWRCGRWCVAPPGAARLRRDRRGLRDHALPGAGRRHDGIPLALAATLAAPAPSARALTAGRRRGWAVAGAVALAAAAVLVIGAVVADEPGRTEDVAVVAATPVDDPPYAEPSSRPARLPTDQATSLGHGFRLLPPLRVRAMGGEQLIVFRLDPPSRRCARHRRRLLDPRAAGRRRLAALALGRARSEPPRPAVDGGRSGTRRTMDVPGQQPRRRCRRPDRPVLAGCTGLARRTGMAGGRAVARRQALSPISSSSRATASRRDTKVSLGEERR